MKRRIEQLLNGKFEYEMKPLKLSTESITSDIAEGEALTGSFQMSAEDGRRARGILFSSSPRVTYMPREFYSSTVSVSYQVDSTGLNCGDEIEGVFTVCSEQGERTIPYKFTVTEEVRTEKECPVASLKELTELAQQDREKAVTVFSAGPFVSWLKKTDNSKLLLYRTLQENNSRESALEEFLIGCGQKRPVALAINETRVKVEGQGKSVMQSFTLRRSTWGYQKLQISSDARFLRLFKKNLTTDDFEGDECRIEYVIDSNFLHPGKNYGRIRIDTCYQSLFLDVEVDPALPEHENTRLNRVQKLMLKRLLSLYVDLRLNRIDMQPWIERSLNVIGGYRRAGGASVYADLFEIQLHFADGKRLKAQHLLQELERNSSRFTTQDEYAFYLYLTTFFRREVDYVDQVEARIEQMFLQNRNNWVIQWILMYLQERLLKDDSAKLEVIEQQCRQGCSSPIMYLEAAQVYKKNPYLLQKLDVFEENILLFAVRQKMMTEELAFQAANLAMQRMTYSSKLFHILKECFDETDSTDVLTAICAILIAGQKKDEKYFRWYSMAVARDVRLTELYEYYMETMDSCAIEKMPQIIRMYFSYNNTLNYHKKASIYRNISDNRENVPQVYRSSRGAIDTFVVQQLSLGRIDHDLAVLYERFITRQLLTETLARKLAFLLFTVEVECDDPMMTSVVVVHPGIRTPQIVAIKDGKANVQVYDEDARILLADKAGKRYPATELYRAKRFLTSPLLHTYCLEMAPDETGLTLYMCRQNLEDSRELVGFWQRASEMDMLTDSYRKELRKKILSYYADHKDDEDLYEYLKRARLPEFMESGKKELIQILTREGLYEAAFDLLKANGPEEVRLSDLVRICSQMILSREYEEDEALLAYCFRCFSFGKYDDNIMNYLLMYYDGRVEDMKKIWMTGYANELDTMTLEEKILTLVLFMADATQGTERIYQSYRGKLGRKKIWRAYQNLKAYEYLVKNLPVSDIVFNDIEADLQHGEEMEDVDKLALLLHYSKRAGLDETRKRYAEELMRVYNSRGIRFAFFLDFPADLRRSLQIDDRVFLEYGTDPRRSVVLNYRNENEDEYTQEIMRDCFEGIFVKEFILFDGEQIECFMQEYDGEKLVRTSSKRILSGGHSKAPEGSRFDLLNRMSAAVKSRDEESLKQQLENYYQTEYLVDEIFPLI